MKQAQDNLKQEQQDQGVGVADVVNAPVPHVDTAVDGVRVLSPAKEKRTLGRPLHRRCPNCAAGSQWKTGDVKPN